MAENESFEGKSYEYYKQQTEMFEQMIIQAINSREEGQEELVLQKGYIQMQVKKVNGVYKLNLLGEEIATINEKGSFSYNVRGLKNIREMVEDQDIVNYNDLGLPDIEYLEYLEKEKIKEEEVEEREKGQGKKEDGEEEKQEENNDEEKDDKEQAEEEKPKLNSKGPNWIKLDLSREVVHNTPLRNLIPNCEKYEEVYIVPGKDQYSYTIQGGSKETGYDVIEELEPTEGRNPTQKMISIQSKGEMEIESKQSLVMFKIRGREDEGFSITEAQPGNEQIRMEYWRKAYNDMYISTTVPQAHADRGVEMPSPEVKYLMAKNQTSRLEMERVFDTHADIEELKQQDVPGEVDPSSDGIELEELDREVLKEKMYEDILRELQEEKGNQIPGFLESKAKAIVDKVLDDGENYEIAKEEAFEDERAPGGGREPGKRRNGE